MNKMGNKLIEISALALIVIGAGGLIGGIICAFISIISAPPEEPVYRLVEVESKTKEWDGQVCFGEGLRACQNTYEYFINAEKVGWHLWQQVEEGKTYKCDQHDNCEETKGEE